MASSSTSPSYSVFIDHRGPNLRNLTGLQSLHLRGCSTLQTLPDLTLLQRLDLHGCSTLQTLPEGNLTGRQNHRGPEDRIGLDQTILQTLDLRGCSNLQWLPEGNLTGRENHRGPEDRIGLDQTILQTERAYSKVLKITSTIYKLFLSFYGIMQVGILTAVFSSQQRKALCKDSWGLLVLSAIVSGGVLIAFLWKYCEQFLLLRRGRRLIQELHSSGISAVDLEVDDLEINRKYWSWITERAAIVIAFMTLSICLWLSCKSRLSC